MTPPAPSKSSLASSISAIALVDREPRRHRAQAVGDQRSERAGALGVVDRPHHPRPDRRLELGVVDPVIGGELRPRLGRRERDGQRLPADLKLARGPVEGRERELLRGLLDSLRVAPSRGSQGSATGVGS